MHGMDETRWYNRASGRADQDYTIDASLIPVGRGVQLGMGWVGKLLGRTVGNAFISGNSIFSLITPKIAKQMGRRGWTKELIHETVNNPFAIRAATNRATGNAATAYFQKNGSYIVKDNVTNEVVQISNRLDFNWIPDATIINPYTPR